MDTMLMSKEKLLEQIQALKVAWESEFSDSVDFYEEEVERWLVRYIHKNDDIEDMFHQLSIDLREMENESFEIKTNHETLVHMGPKCDEIFPCFYNSWKNALKFCLSFNFFLVSPRCSSI
jgi:hypothetical protein